LYLHRIRSKISYFVYLINIGKLSVTALAWWCRSPAWLDDLPADEVIPMFFRMGRDNVRMRHIVEHTPELLHASCRQGSAGFAPQEPFAPQVIAGTSAWRCRHTSAAICLPRGAR